MILVAHRLTTLLETDRIIVFEDGKVVETGRYDDLVQADGAGLLDPGEEPVAAEAEVADQRG